MIRMHLCVLSFLMILIPAQARVLDWSHPSTVRVIVGQSPGGGNEFAFRGVGHILEKNIPGIRFLLEHRPGLDNVVAMNHFAAQKPDGQRLLVMVQATGLVAAPIAYRQQLTTDPMTFRFVTNIAQSPMAFVVHPDSDIRSVSDLIRLAQDPRRRLNIGISGSINLLAYSYFVQSIQSPEDAVQAVRFNSPTQASLAVVSRDIDVAIVPMSVTKALIDAGRIKLLAHTGASEIPGMRSTSLMKNHIPGFELEATWSVFLPPATDRKIVEWYAVQFAKALNTPQAMDYFVTNWAQIDRTALGPNKMAETVERLRETWMHIAETVLRN